MRRLAETALNRADSKADALLTWLRGNIRPIANGKTIGSWGLQNPAA
jgi:post-segregation antitoxin (ccd killing protein)